MWPDGVGVVGKDSQLGIVLEVMVFTTVSKVCDIWVRMVMEPWQVKVLTAWTGHGTWIGHGCSKGLLAPQEVPGGQSGFRAMHSRGQAHL